MYVYTLSLFQVVGTVVVAVPILAGAATYVLVQRHRERKRQEAERARREELRRQREAEVAEEVARVNAESEVRRAERARVRAERNACIEAGDFTRARILNERLAQLLQ